MREIVWYSPTLEERYWSYVDQRSLDECWPWTGHREHFGHGVIYVGKDARGRGVNEKAHRVAWMYAYPEPAGELFVRHQCDNPPCQNPDHLLLGTQTDNLRDMYERKRGRPGHAKPGAGHHFAKLTEEQALEIIALRHAGNKVQAIADMFGIRHSQVSRITTGKRWAHLQKGT